MSTEIICTIITAIGVVLSSLISYGISRLTTNKEIEKMRLAWQREDVVSSDEEFSAMAEAVAKYVHSPSGRTKSTAMGHVAAIRTKETGNLGKKLDELYSNIYHDLTSSVDQQLSKVIEQKRETKSNANAAKRKNP